MLGAAVPCAVQERVWRIRAAAQCTSTQYAVLRRRYAAHVDTCRPRRAAKPFRPHAMRDAPRCSRRDRSLDCLGNLPVAGVIGVAGVCAAARDPAARRARRARRHAPAPSPRSTHALAAAT